MSGIVGIWGEADEKLARKMMQLICHRGPDAEGIYSDSEGKIALGHRGLSIMDHSEGDPLIYNENQTKAIVADAKIYNFPEIKKFLSTNHRFRTQSDSESILHLYEEVDNVVAKRLDGVFAFAIADGKNLFLARDALGIKPLYYAKKESALVFASELKAFAGIAENIEEFPPGACFHSKFGFRPYYIVPDMVPRNMPLPIHLKILRETLEQAVIKCLMGDVSAGVFLSGGLNSSIIAAIAKRHLGKIKTFSAGIKGSHHLEAARFVANHLDTDHHEYIYSVDEVLKELKLIIYHLESFDRDIVRSSIQTYFASLLASKEVKVILTDEGADELFAGYHHYRFFKEPEEIQQEFRRSLSTLHRTHLQRIDRMTMAHSIEGRLPFLDLDMIEMAQIIPPELKLFSDKDHPLTGKWILRKAFEDILPPKIIWRDKEQPEEGSGISGVLPVALESLIKPLDVKLYYKRYSNTKLRSAEECFYHKLLSEAYSNPKPILSNV